ncbi:hypothetical protein ACKF11_13925 [Methylobacillus sp. Pita2]|uniref:hypothetical protein n=1 Tax=Methylobacillus sp. Pita2 TaxID=3383245 RepID=UPI0038B56069
MENDNEVFSATGGLGAGANGVNAASQFEQRLEVLKTVLTGVPPLECLKLSTALSNHYFDRVKQETSDPEIQEAFAFLEELGEKAVKG